MNTWLLLHYKLPNQPTASRVYVWRKLKRLGALLLHDAVWVLPDQPRTAEQIQWLATEIQEMGGEAFSWRVNAIPGELDDFLTQKFKEQVDRVYSDLLEKLEKRNTDLQGISRQYRQVASQDFFHTELGLQVRERLMLKRGEKS